MHMSEAKQKIIAAVQKLPEDWTVDQILERIELMWKVEQGFENYKSGNTVSLEEVKEEAREWKKNRSR